MKEKIKQFLDERGKWVVLGSIGFLVLGLGAFVLGYGLVDGFDAVLAWFTSKWAIMVYVFIVVWFFAVALFWRLAKVGGKDDE